MGDHLEQTSEGCMDAAAHIATRFCKGDLVRVADDLGPTMRHFTGGCDAIVIGSYADQYGGRDHNSYTVYIRGRGSVSWYYGRQLTLIERGRTDMLEQWENEGDAANKLHSSLDWIFANGEEVLTRGTGASIAALAKGLGCDNLWGSHGEGLTYYENALRTLDHAGPFLKDGDKDGWLAYCQTVRASQP